MSSLCRFRGPSYSLRTSQHLYRAGWSMDQGRQAAADKGPQEASRLEKIPSKWEEVDAHSVTAYISV
ncbi:hypothetical protein LEMLEM_LOCUS26650 [Lemmus lemmus]